jgi:hypothetical protein
MGLILLNGDPAAAESCRAVFNSLIPDPSCDRRRILFLGECGAFTERTIPAEGLRSSPEFELQDHVRWPSGMSIYYHILNNFRKIIMFEFLAILRCLKKEMECDPLE